MSYKIQEALDVLNEARKSVERAEVALEKARKEAKQEWQIDDIVPGRVAYDSFEFLILNTNINGEWFFTGLKGQAFNIYGNGPMSKRQVLQELRNSYKKGKVINIELTDYK